MISYTTYKFLHLAAIFLMLLSLGAIASHRLQGGSKQNFKNRKFFSALNGVGLLVSFVAGFGLIARAGYNFGSPWIWGKIGVWLVLGMYPVIFYKKGDSKKPYLALIGILLFALYLVEVKPTFGL